MTAVSGITNSPTAGVNAPTARGVLGKDDFLRLLLTQLQNQDPLSPADPTEFTAQLSQFSSLEQLFSINEHLAQANSGGGDMERLAALSLLDREAVAAVNHFSLGEGGMELGYDLAGPADDVNLYVQDQQGVTVAVLPADERQAGEHFITWDGTDQNGRQLPVGEYNILVSATSGEDAVPVTAVPLIKGIVTGVDLVGGESIIVTNAGEFHLADVKSVRSL